MNLVGDGECGEQIGPARLSHFGCGQDCAEIVGWMARLTGSDIAVHEIQVAAESAIVERRVRWRIQRPDGNPDRVQHANLHLLQGLLAQALEPGTSHKPCELLYLC